MTLTTLVARLLALAALALPGPAAAKEALAPMSPEALSAITRELSSDAFEGRAPGTNGERRTVAYLIERLQAAGVEPAGDAGGWTQAVPLIRTRVGAPATIGFEMGRQAMPLVQGTGIYVSSIRPADRVRIAAAPVVFVGYGVAAPERQWDDFKGVDLNGKVAVFLVNDPDFEAKPGESAVGRFGDRAMTYYGRWTYKFEEAARRGAIAALIVHDTPGAGYGWSTVTAPGGENYDIVRAAGAQKPVALQGWIEGGAARDLFARAGLDLAALRIAARQPGFRPVTLTGTNFSADVPVAVERVASVNVLGKLTGTKRPRETIMFGAHWDAYGQSRADAQGRTIRPGAADDAVGVAGVIEVARAFAAGPRPERTLVFALWTGEERGLLGSETYATKPVFALETTVANLTMDILQTGGPARDVVLVGPGQSDLEDDLAVAAAFGQERVVTPETLPERGLFYRADHFSVARRGVPTILLMGIAGPHDLVEGGREAGQRWLDGYMACYHQTCDAWTPAQDYRGVAQDVALLHAVGRSLANSTRWPAWRADSEFKALRDASAAARR